MSLNYSIIDTIKLFELAFKNKMFIAIIISSVIFALVLVINRNNRYLKYGLLLVNICLITLVLYYYFKGIISFNFNNPINNIYFYFFNTIIFLILFSIVTFKTKYKRINYIFYCLSLINIIYSLYITYYFKNVVLITIGNIFPMIKFGNIMYIIYYTIFLIMIGGKIWKKKST